MQASRLSFRELFEELQDYIDDPQRRWEECLRVKRGLHDTSLPGAFCKDQVSFHCRPPLSVVPPADHAPTPVHTMSCPVPVVNTVLPRWSHPDSRETALAGLCLVLLWQSGLL